MNKLTPIQTYEKYSNMFKNKEFYRSFDYFIFDETMVQYGHQNDCNTEYCTEHNIPCYQLQRNGGCCAMTAGNIGILTCTEYSKKFFQKKFLNDFRLYLEEHGINATIDSNDILVDGYKVASCVQSIAGTKMDWITGFFQISINQDIETIKNVCKKEMAKVPKGLGEYGINTNEVEEWIKI